MISIIHNEKALINTIRYGAIIIIIMFSIFITNIFIKEKNKDFEMELQKIEEDYISKNKITIENIVNKIYSIIEVEKKIEEDEVKESIKERVNEVYSIIDGIYKQTIKDPNYSKEKTIKLIKESLRNMRFNDDLGYIFIYELDGKNILNSQYPENEGQNHWNYKDARGVLLLQEMKKIMIEKDETFYTWYWKKPNNNSTQEYEKHGFLKKFTPYDMYIGAGTYVDDFENKLKQRVLKKINSLKFKEPEHVFVFDKDANCLANPKKELIGLNQYNAKNENGEYVLRKIIENTIKNKEGFERYQGLISMKKENISSDKISFLKLFEKWNWIIGSGFYLEDMYKEIKIKKETLDKSNKKVVEEIMLISAFATIIMIISSFYMSTLIEKMFKKYANEIETEIKNSLEKEKLLIQQSKMATMGEMLGNIAHQWKQPLSLIAMSNTLIKLNQDNKDFSSENELKEAVKSIDISVKNLSQTIDDFRDFFKPEKEKSKFKLEELFEKTYELISSQFKNNNIQIIKEIENIELYGRSNELSQVLINIIKNAKDELIKIKNNDRRLIFINMYKKDSKAIIKIKDNAGGINKDIINKIFDAYFTTKEQTDGTGIGLYMSKQIIQEMNGKIEVSNEKYKYEDVEYLGAQFTIYLDL